MTKQRKSVSVDPEVYNYLSREGVNASELVNKLVKQHMAGGATKDEIREFRIRQLESEYQDLAASARRKLTELNEIRQRSEKDDEKFNDRLGKLEAVLDDGGRLFESHGMVKEVADECNLTPREVMDEIKERNPDVPAEKFTALN